MLPDSSITEAPQIVQVWTSEPPLGVVVTERGVQLHIEPLYLSLRRGGHDVPLALADDDAAGFLDRDGEQHGLADGSLAVIATMISSPARSCS
jgi:hypothetical protein